MDRIKDFVKKILNNKKELIDILESKKTLDEKSLIILSSSFMLDKNDFNRAIEISKKIISEKHHDLDIEKEIISHYFFGSENQDKEYLLNNKANFVSFIICMVFTYFHDNNIKVEDFKFDVVSDIIADYNSPNKPPQNYSEEQKENLRKYYQRRKNLKEENIVCPNCNSKDILFNKENSDYVCKKCGNVWNDES